LDPNTPYPDFRLNEIFNGRGSLEEIWDSIETSEANQRLKCNLDTFTDDFIVFSSLMSKILADDGKPVELLMSKDVADLLGYLKNETPSYMASGSSIGAFYTGTPDAYTSGFYAFLDALYEGDQRPGDKDVADMFRKFISRSLDMKTPLEIQSDIQDFIDDINAPLFDKDFNNVSSFIGKLLVQADYPLWINSSGKILNRNTINPALDTNLGVGNAVQGINTLVNWMNSIMVNPDTRTLVHGVIEETGKLFDPAATSTHALKIKILLKNIKDCFTVGGSIYETNPLYKSVSTEIGRAHV
jgi:hypothetical protein